MSEVRVTDALTGGEKGSKPERFDLSVSPGLTELARVYGYGATKYADHNWRKGYKWSLSIAALHRHLNQWLSGERFDSESQCNHLAHVMWHCLTLMEYERLGLGTDDRVCASDASIQYLAGIVDGEGCITIATRKRKAEGRNDGHVLSLSVQMTVDAPLEALKYRFGGSISKPRREGPNRRPIRTWSVSGRLAYVALRQLEPYLVVKKLQAIGGLEFQERKVARAGSTKPLTETERKVNQAHQNAIKSLNAGSAPEPKAYVDYTAHVTPSPFGLMASAMRGLWTAREQKAQAEAQFVVGHEYVER